MNIDRQTCSSGYFLECALLFLDDNVDQECEQFSSSKTSVSGLASQGLLSICLIFCQVQPGLAYKSFAYKKACNLITRLNLGFSHFRERKFETYFQYCLNPFCVGRNHIQSNICSSLTRCSIYKGMVPLDKTTSIFVVAFRIK